jgi:hypothetical protein
MLFDEGGIRDAVAAIVIVSTHELAAVQGFEAVATSEVRCVGKLRATREVSMENSHVDACTCSGCGSLAAPECQQQQPQQQFRNGTEYIHQLKHAHTLSFAHSTLSIISRDLMRPLLMILIATLWDVTMCSATACHNDSIAVDGTKGVSFQRKCM